ncbi:hypothetical protein SD15574_5464 [Shigella dysenteriae 155-74]|nr:hypothetical protein Sd1012_4873 [Shigella dysenteriae 1012]EGJ03665.1 hypothetical protein SD15574_5464 [Shigella dysenteriae 155-74]
MFDVSMMLAFSYRQFIDRNLNPQKIKKAPKNARLFNTT